MVTPNPMTPEQRVQRARLGAHCSWARTRDPAARTAAARHESHITKFEREVDPDGVLPPEERQRRARAAKSAYFTALAFRSSRVRAARARTKVQTECELSATADGGAA
jgi:hypothetical protein